MGKSTFLFGALGAFLGSMGMVDPAAPIGEFREEGREIAASETGGDAWALAGKTRWSRRSWDHGDGLPSAPITGIGQDPWGFLWLQTEHGLTCFDGRRFDSERRAPKGLELRCDPGTAGDPETLRRAAARDRCLFRDRDGNLWVARGKSEKGTLGRHTGELELWAPGLFAIWDVESGLPDDHVTSLLPSAEDRLYLTTRRAGLLVMDLGALATEPPRLVPTPTRELWAVAETASGLAVGSVDMGVLQASHSALEAAHGDSDPKSPEIWRALHRGQDTPLVFRLLSARDGSLWVGSFEGLERHSAGRQWSFDHEDGLPTHSVRGLYEDYRGRIWIATSAGLARYQPQAAPPMAAPPMAPPREEAPALTAWTAEDGLSVAKIAAIWDDGTAVWVATGGGLARIDDLDRIAVLSRRQGLFADDLTAVAGDDHGHLWLGAGNRVARIRIADLHRYLDLHSDGSTRALGSTEPLPQEIFDLRDGLPGFTVEMLAYENDRLWVGSRGGLALLDTARLERSVPPAVRILDMRRDGQPLAADASPVLEPRPREVSFGVSVAELVRPEQIALRYRLSGFDETWRRLHGSDQRIVFAHLPAGNYLLEVEASTRSGEFVGIHEKLAFRIEPGFGQTVASRLLLLMLAIGTLLAAHRLRIRILSWEEERLSREVDAAVDRVMILGGLLPVCCKCKKIRDDEGIWMQLELYLEEHSEARFEARPCPSCRASNLDTGATT